MDIISLVMERGSVNVKNTEGKLYVYRSLIFSGTGKIVIRETYVSKDGEVALDCTEMGEARDQVVKGEVTKWERI